jgi:hypothetical protein
MTDDAPKLAERRTRGKLARFVRYGEEQLAELEPYYRGYVRLHRLLYDCDPEPEEVSVEGE